MNQLHTASTDQSMLVLNRRTQSRLDDVNDATRALRTFGVKVIRQNMRLGSNKRPLLQLQQGTEELRAELLHIVNGIGDTGPQVMGQFMNVDVCFPLLMKVAG